MKLLEAMQNFFKLELENLLFHVKGIKAIEKQLAVE